MMNLASKSLKAVVLASGLCAALSSTLALAGEAYDHIVKSNQVRIAVPVDYPPYGFVGPDMAPQGLDIDVARLMAKNSGSTCCWCR